ncbi:MAG: putative major capsid protein [Prokaryotic dsDNA virus sp.]|nr:MAG: putative major capsid protein [Prokaryotic dsDNA virus sp.]|tara:strand:- start:5156 stop:6448 length:1293 start_codon:yes stop_codon:yes gene_type:complete
MSEEIKTELKGIYDSVTAFQSALDEVKGKVDGLDNEKLEKMAKDAADGIDAVNKERAEEKAAAKELEQKVAFLEGKIARGDAGEDAGDPEFKHAVARYLRKGVLVDEEHVERAYKAYAEKNLFGADDREVDRQVKDMVAASGPDGGYFVTTDRSNQISERIFETSPLRQVANVVTTTSDVYELILDDDESDSGWVGEVQSRPDTNTPQVGLIKIPVHEVYAQPRATQKMLDDAGFDIEGWLSRKVSSQIGRKENTSFVAGDGSQKPKGFLSYAAWSSAGVYERNAVEQITSGTSGDFDADDIIELGNSLIEDYQANATFGMKRATFTDVMQLKSSDGAYLLDPRILMEGGTKMLLGKDVVFMEDMPVKASNALAMVVADFEEFYTVVDRLGIRVLRDPYTAKPYVRYYTTKRVGGAVTNYEAGKILKIAA